jgi:hypothetical protein
MDGAWSKRRFATVWPDPCDLRNAATVASSGADRCRPRDGADRCRPKDRLGPPRSGAGDNEVEIHWVRGFVGESDRETASECATFPRRAAGGSRLTVHMMMPTASSRGSGTPLPIEPKGRARVLDSADGRGSAGERSRPMLPAPISDVAQEDRASRSWGSGPFKTSSAEDTRRSYP